MEAGASIGAFSHVRPVTVLERNAYVGSHVEIKASRVGVGTHIGHFACLTDDGKRTWGTVEDPAILDAMTRDEFCGRRGSLDGTGKLSLD